MADLIVSASELARNTSALLDEVTRGRTVEVRRRGRTIARLVPSREGGAAVLGRLAGRAHQVTDDDALMEPLPDWPT